MIELLERFRKMSKISQAYGLVDLVSLKMAALALFCFKFKCFCITMRLVSSPCTLPPPVLIWWLFNEAGMVRVLRGCLLSGDVRVHDLTYLFLKKKEKAIKVDCFFRISYLPLLVYKDFSISILPLLYHHRLSSPLLQFFFYFFFKSLFCSKLCTKFTILFFKKIKRLFSCLDHVKNIKNRGKNCSDIG